VQIIIHLFLCQLHTNSLASLRTSVKHLGDMHDRDMHPSDPAHTTRRRRRRSASLASKASTHLSEFDLVSPPRQQPSQHFSEGTGDGGDDTFAYNQDRHGYASSQGDSHSLASGWESQGYHEPECMAAEWQPSHLNAPETTRNDVC
jgi:hypothetical protein